MGLPHYLAMTPEEFTRIAPLPDKPAWMSCRFSPQDQHLIHIPSQLPAGSILIIDDAFDLIDPNLDEIIQSLKHLFPALHGVLLDFQKPNNEVIPQLAHILSQQLPCPVGLSSLYAKEWEGPVFLPPVPLHLPIEEHLAPYAHQELWLDTSPESEQIHVTSAGIHYSPTAVDKSAFLHKDSILHCHYGIEIREDEICFHLYK